MTWIFLLAVLVVLLFGFVVFFGAPFLPTLKAKNEDIFELLDLRAGQTLLELGSGDGRILRAAAERGITGIGYELNPLLVLWSRLRNRKYREFMTVHWGNYWQTELPKADAIYVFLLDKYMEKLDNKIIQERQGRLKLVSFAFKVPGRKIARELNGLFLYTYE